MEFTFVMACWFSRCPACRFGLTASFRSSLSVVNRLIRPTGFSPVWLMASLALTHKLFYRAQKGGLFTLTMKIWIVRKQELERRRLQFPSGVPAECCQQFLSPFLPVIGGGDSLDENRMERYF